MDSIRLSGTNNIIPRLFYVGWDLALVAVGNHFSRWVRAGLPFGAAGDAGSFRVPLEVIGAGAVIWGVLALILRTYHSKPSSDFRDETKRLAGTWAGTFVLLAPVWFLIDDDVSLWQVVYAAISVLILVNGHRFLAGRELRAGVPSSRPEAQRRVPTMILVSALLVVLVAFALRMYSLDGQSLWEDEVFTFRRAISHLTPALAGDLFRRRELFNMAYDLVVGPSVLLIPSAIGLRFPAVLVGTLTVAMAYRVATTLANPRGGLVVAVFFAIWPVHLYYSQEGRQYALVLLGTLLSLWMLLLLLSERNVWWARVSLPVSVIVTAALNVLSILWLGTLFVIALVQRWWVARRLRWWVWVPALGGMLGVLVLMYTLSLYRLRAWEWVNIPTHLDLVNFVDNVVGLSLVFTKFDLPVSWIDLAIWVVLLYLGSLGVVRLLEKPGGSLPGAKGGSGWLLLLPLGVVPPLVAFVLSYAWRPMYVVRYFLPSMGSLLLLMAVAAGALRWRWLTGAFVAVVMAASAHGAARYYFDMTYHRPDWRGATAYVVDHRLPDDELVVLGGHAHSFYLIDQPPIVETSYSRRVGWEALEVLNEQMTLSFERTDRVWIIHHKYRWMIDVEDWKWLGGPSTSAVEVDYVDFGELDVYLYQQPEAGG